MAFTDRRPDSHRAAKVVAVSAIHAVVIYGLVTGLTIHMLPTPIWHVPTKNYPADPPPPPPPEKAPKQKPDEVKLVSPVPVPLAPPLGDLKIDPIPLPLPTAPVQLVLPPPSPTPSFAPKQAKPRNDPSLWVTTNDYPTREIREGHEGAVRFLLRIDAGGKVQGCEIVGSSGYPALDNATCTNVERRARFTPANDSAGDRVAGTYSSVVRWVIPKD